MVEAIVITNMITLLMGFYRNKPGREDPISDVTGLEAKKQSRRPYWD